MSSKSAIYAINTNTGATLATDSVYPVTSIVRRFGKYIDLAGEGIIIGNDCDRNGSVGYYDIEATVTVVAGAAGVVTAQIYINGAPLAGATSSQSVGNGGTVTLPLSGVTRIKCGCQQQLITIVVSGVTTSTSNLAITVEKE